MATLGERLREERERRGLTIEELARQTRISARFFEAIERDDASALPSGFFYRSFVRQYARLLDLPEETYSREIERSLAEESGKPYTVPERHIDVPPLPTAKRNRKEEAKWWAARAGGLVLALALCTGVYVGWERWKASQPAPAAGVEEKAAKGEAAPPAPEASTPAAEPAPAPPPVVESGSVRVILRASDLSWVGVWQGKKFLFGDLMRAGEVRGFGGDDVLRVKIGNAGAVSVEWNGQELPAFGPKGQVRTVEFRPDRYEVIQPSARREMEEGQPNGIAP
ncbi:MAG: RodZ domain-containing protein [Bryobacteraceae bacterium]|jgi:transcriptional regulator with XRE-family HTH domain